MELTKYEHACFTVEKNGHVIVVDPGNLTSDFTVPDNVVAVVITHKHSDHCDDEHIELIMESNPTAVIIGPVEVTRQFSQYDTHPVKGGDSFAIHGFDLDFYGDDHATIATNIPPIKNVGVLIEDRLYYPGDSFTVPEKSVDTLALPIAAPWLKISEAIDFMNTVSARMTFPTHDGVLSAAGWNIYDRLLESSAETAGTIYQRLDGQTIAIE